MPNVLYSLEGPANGLPIYQSSTPPTAIQSAVVQEIVVQLGMVLADTQALVTHNLGYNTIQAGVFARPQIVGPVWINGPLGGGTSTPMITFDTSNTNVLKVNKLGVAGTEGTFTLYLRRPFSMSK